MRAGNTREVRKFINMAIADLGAINIMTWTDPPVWSDWKTKDRVVTYRVSKADEVAVLANEMLRDVGYSNVVRVTDGESLPCGEIGAGPYVKVNAELA
jgi:hypothetical protein